MTSVTRTVADLAEAGIERDYLADLVADALRKENVRIDDLAEKLKPAARSYGAKTGTQLVSELSEAASSMEDIVEWRDRYVHSMPDIEMDPRVEKVLTERMKLVAVQLEEKLAPILKQIHEIEKQWGSGSK